jgi:hypothetical protein
MYYIFLLLYASGFLSMPISGTIEYVCVRGREGGKGRGMVLIFLYYVFYVFVL